MIASRRQRDTRHRVIASRRQSAALGDDRRQQAEIEWNCGVLRIEVNSADDISFTLHEQPFVEAVTFRCAPEDLISTFETFLHTNKWVSDAAFEPR
jgi:hypothetical protein